MEIPSLLDLLKAGAHFGHKVSRRHPKMSPFIFTSKGDIHLINLELTQKKLQEAIDFVRALGKEGKTLLFIGTKKQVQEVVKKYAIECGLPYVTEKWLGGTFTNFGEINRRVRHYLDLKNKKTRGELGKYTKLEQVKFDTEIVKMEKKIGGISTMARLPDAVFIVDLKQEETAFEESRKKKIPVVAVCDTNVNPTYVKHVIPANDDAVKSVELIVKLIAGAYMEGKAEGGVVSQQPIMEKPIV